MTIAQFWRNFSVTKSCLILCNPMDYSIPVSSVLFCLLKFPQIHIHWVYDVMQASHPLSSPSLPALNFSQHQGLFQWIGSSHQTVKALELQLQHQSYQWIFRVDFLQDWFFDLFAVQETLKSLLQSSTTICKHQFFNVQPSLCTTFTSVHDYWKKHSFDYTDLCRKSDVSAFNVLSRSVITSLPRRKCFFNIMVFLYFCCCFNR